MLLLFWCEQVWLCPIRLQSSFIIKISVTNWYIAYGNTDFGSVQWVWPAKSKLGKAQGVLKTERTCLHFSLFILYKWLKLFGLILSLVSFWTIKQIAVKLTKNNTHCFKLNILSEKLAQVSWNFGFDVQQILSKKSQTKTVFLHFVKHV